MDVFVGGRFAIVGYDFVSKKRDVEARLIDSFNENILI